MDWVTRVEVRGGDGKIKPTHVTAFAKVFTPDGGAPVIQLDTFGSEDRAMPDKQSQTLQFGKDSAAQLFQFL
jgi:hypothetical protein